MINASRFSLPLLLAGAALSGVASVSAQTTIDGSAEVTYNSNATRNNDQENNNGALLQNYALGLSSSLIDPRIFKYNTEGIFRTSRLTSGGTLQPDGSGHQGDVGYRLGASLLPASSIPFFIQASRTISNSQGDLGPTNPVRAGMIAPTGAPPVDFESRNKTLNLGWQVNLGALPRVELGYRDGNSVVTGGGYEAQQNDRDISARVTKDTARTRQAFHFQQTDFETQLSRTFSQNLKNLDYDLGLDLTKSLHLTGHTGRRTTFARSDFAPTVDTSQGAYVPPPATGLSGADYALVGLRFEPGPRFDLRFDGSTDRQTSAEAQTTSRLVAMSSHLELVKGLRLTGTGVSGTRGQLVANTPTDVNTRSLVGGATYQATLRWLSGTVTATRGTGRNVTRDGRLGAIESWSREASLSTSFPWVSLGGGYERSQSRDDILDFGNYNSERFRASAQTGSRRLSVTANADQARVERGIIDQTYASNLQRSVSGTVSLRIRHDGYLSATGGQFQNDYNGVAGSGRDQTLFWGVNGRAVLGQLTMTAAVRRENAAASLTGFDQRALNGNVRLEYRVRMLHVAAEYREGQSRLQYIAMPSPDSMRGRQLRFSVIRQFGFRR